MTEQSTATNTETKVEKVQANGVTRPKDGTKTVVVWEQADAISAKQASPARRKDVIEACLAQGINAATAATQYGRWRKFHGLKGSDEPTPAPAAAEGGQSDVTTEAEQPQG